MSISKTTKKSLASLEKITGGRLTIGRMLWAIRQGEELSQVDFSRQLGISKQRLCDIEHHRRFVSPKTAAQYAETLGYSADQFVRISVQDMLENEGIRAEVDIKLIKASKRLKTQFA